MLYTHDELHDELQRHTPTTYSAAAAAAAAVFSLEILRSIIVLIAQKYRSKLYLKAAVAIVV